MSQALSDYFVVEAGEYLAKLDQLLAGAEPPDAERLFRLARAVRGSAEMAQADKIAAVAAHLEAGARSLAAGRAVWREPFRSQTLRTVADLKALVGGVRNWGRAEEARAREALARWTAAAEGRAAGAAARSDTPTAGFAGGSGAATRADVVPIEALFYDDAGPHILNTGANPADVVPIEALLFAGEDALREALALRPELDRLIAPLGEGGSELRERLDELFELVRLGLSPPAPGVAA